MESQHYLGQVFKQRSSSGRCRYGRRSTRSTAMRRPG